WQCAKLMQHVACDLHCVRLAIERNDARPVGCRSSEDRATVRIYSHRRRVISVWAERGRVADAQDHKRRRGPVVALGNEGRALATIEVRAVRLIADELLRNAEAIPLLEPGLSKNPVIVVLDNVAHLGTILVPFTSVP